MAITQAQVDAAKTQADKANAAYDAGKLKHKQSGSPVKISSKLRKLFAAEEKANAAYSTILENYNKQNKREKAEEKAAANKKIKAAEEKENARKAAAKKLGAPKQEVKSEPVVIANLAKRRKTIVGIPENKRTNAQKADLKRIDAKIAQINKGKTRRIERGAKAPPASGQLTPPPVTISGADESGQGKQAPTEASLEYASKKAKERDAADKKRKAAEEKKRAQKAAAEKLGSKAAGSTEKLNRGAASPTVNVPKRPRTSAASPTVAIGKRYKRPKSNSETDFENLRKGTEQETFNPQGVTNQSTNRYRPTSDFKLPDTNSSDKSSGKSILADAGEAATGLVSGIAKGLKNLVSGDFKADVPTKGTPEYEAYISSDPRAMNPDVRDLKKGGKVTKKKKKASYGKKYSMNRGGKVASLRKPTRA